MKPSLDTVVQIIPCTGYFMYLTNDGTIWRTIDPASDEWEIMPTPIGKPTKVLFKKGKHA